MTQPYPPNQYAPQQAVNYGPPQGAPQYPYGGAPAGYVPPQGQQASIPQGYAPQQGQQYQQAPAQAAPPQAFNGVGSFVDPTMRGAGEYSKVRVRDIRDRALVVLVQEYDETAMSLDGKKREPRIRFDAMIVDGGPIQCGGTKDNGYRSTHVVDAPHFAKGLLSSHANVVNQLSQYAGTGALVVGRIVQGITKNPENSRPWNFVPFTDKMSQDELLRNGITPERPAADAQARQQAAAVWAAHLSGQFVNPEPVEIGAPQYATQQAPQMVPQGGMLPNPAQGMQASIPQGYAPQQGQPVMTQQGQQTVNYGPPQGAPQPLACPQGWDPYQWNMMSPDQHRQVLGQGSPIAGAQGAPTGF